MTRKTAEEILKENGVYMTDFISSSGHAATVHSMYRFLDLYKDELKKLVRARYRLFNDEIKLKDRDQTFDAVMFELENFIEIIDTVK